MGLATHGAGLSSRWFSLLLLLLAGMLVLLGACEREIDFDDVAAQRYLFVDGAVTVGSDEHAFVVGRTAGPGQNRFDTVTDATLTLTDLATEQTVVCPNGASGRYVCALAGAYDRGYRLEVGLAGGEVYAAEAAPLREAAVDLSLSAGPSRRIGTDGAEIAGDRLRVRLSASPAPRSPPVVLLTSSELGWSYIDVSTSILEPARACYFVDPVLQSLSVLDATQAAPGETLAADIAELDIGARVALRAAVRVSVSRYPAAALPYLRTLTPAIRQDGSIFAERPYTALGNVRAVGSGGDDDAAVPMLGYVGVRELRALVVPVSTALGDARRPRGLCFEGRPTAGIYDCFECLNSPGASAVPPPWWPF